jgi:lysophospholipase L1-like esterase
MKTVLCYGDSNTWGSDPSGGDRFARDVRWPGVLRRRLGPGYEVTEEGKGGRTTVYDSPISGSVNNGRLYLEPCLESHQPLDLVIIMLGTNDFQARFVATVGDVVSGLSQLVRMALWYAPVLLVVPPPLEEMPQDLEEQYAGGHEKSRRLAQKVREGLSFPNCTVFDAGAVVRFSEMDGLHLSVDGHEALGNALADVVADLLSG